VVDKVVLVSFLVLLVLELDHHSGVG